MVYSLRLDLDLIHDRRSSNNAGGLHWSELEGPTDICVDCSARLVYYPRLSNPKAPNEHRVLVYACPDCTDDLKNPKCFQSNVIK